MIYKNIDLHNVAELVELDGKLRWLRVPERVQEAMETEGGKNACRNHTGVELRFVMLSDEVKLKIRPINPKGNVAVNVYFGGMQAGWQGYGEGPYFNGESEIVIKRPANMEMIKRMSGDSGYDWSAEVVRVMLRGLFELVDVEGEVRPPERSELPKKTLLTYGSSITHGSNALTPSCTWASVLAHNLNVDLINLGMPGSCRMEPELVDYIASLDWDAALLELGINVLAWEEELIRQRVSNTLSQVAGRHPDKKVYVMSPIFCHDDYQGKGEAKKWREVIEAVIKEMAYPNVEYINGLDIMGDVSGLSGDEVHPNIYGIQQISARLTERITR